MAYIPLHRNAKNIVGQRYGRLIALGAVDRRKTPNGTQLLWKCQCDCGAFTSVTSTDLKNGNTKSCGCLMRQINAGSHRTHGKTETPEYNAWEMMKVRCKPNHKQAKDYFERGIRVCERWNNSFVDFLSDIGDRPSPKHSLDRRDNDKGYEPGNVHWVTRGQQMQNRRNSHIATAFGETKPLAAFFPNGSKHPNYAKTRARFGYGWPHEKIILMGLLGR